MSQLNNNHMETMQTIKRIMIMVDNYRSQLEGRWPTPPMLDCIKFALTEAGELQDALLRQNDTYVRNNEKDHSVQDEAADCLMMIASALNQCEDVPIYSPSYHHPEYRRVFMLFSLLGAAGQLVADEQEREHMPPNTSSCVIIYLTQCAVICLDVLGNEAEEMVRGRLERIAVKV